MKVNFVLNITLVLMLASACKNDREQNVKGVITEATMNTLMITTTQGDTLNVSTLDAVREVENGILLGDTATVYYQGKPQHGVIMATKIVVVPARQENPDLLGCWVQPINGMPEQEQGFALEKDGIARSLNMATLKYETWKQEGDNLILKGKSIGNGQTIEFTDTLRLDKVTTDSLWLSKGEYQEVFKRRVIVECH